MHLQSSRSCKQPSQELNASRQHIIQGRIIPHDTEIYPSFCTANLSCIRGMRASARNKDRLQLLLHSFLLISVVEGLSFCSSHSGFVFGDSQVFSHSHCGILRLSGLKFCQAQWQLDLLAY